MLRQNLAVSLLAAGTAAACATTPISNVSSEPPRVGEEHRFEKPRYAGVGTPHPKLAASPVTDREFAELKASLLFSEEDEKWLRHSHDILEPQVEEILDVWYGFVGSQPHLLRYFSNEAGEPQSEYLAAVRRRFGAWILDTAEARFDRDWLDYQHEVGRRHHRTGKNQTDAADAAAHIHFRHLVGLTFPIVHTLKPFLSHQDASPEQVERMHEAWRKAVLMQVVLWSHPYVKEGDF